MRAMDGARPYRDVTVLDLVSAEAYLLSDPDEHQLHPPPAVLANLEHLRVSVLQPVQEQIRARMTILGGYRSLLLNAKLHEPPWSQHRLGEAADCRLPASFLTSAKAAPIRDIVNRETVRLVGRPVSRGVNASYYLFAWLCIYLPCFPIDEVVHEGGAGPGRPAWVHVSATRGANRAAMAVTGRYVPGRRRSLTLSAALSLGAQRPSSIAG